MQLDTTSRDFMRGAAWHLQRGQEQYRTLEVERASTFGSRPETLRDAVPHPLGWVGGVRDGGDDGRPGRAV